jgi:hypothetical protein
MTTLPLNVWIVPDPDKNFLFDGWNIGQENPVCQRKFGRKIGCNKGVSHGKKPELRTEGEYERRIVYLAIPE